MSRQINQPINQVKLTNVAIVRFNKAGKRFEIACYRNKILDYRTGLEKDLTEVLQTDRIFTNVSKGQFAKSEDLRKAFGSTDEEVIAQIILEKGNSVQVSDLERQQQLQNTLSQVATWVANHCVHPNSARPYTVRQIKHYLEHNYTIQPHKPIKKQYLDAVKFLKTVIPIERAKMELRLQYDVASSNVIQEELRRLKAIVVLSRVLGENAIEVVTIHVDPSAYRELDELAQRFKGRLDIIQQVVVQEGDVVLEEELERKKKSKNERANLNESLSSSESEIDLLERKLKTVRVISRDQADSDGEESSSQSVEEDCNMSNKERQKHRKRLNKKLARNVQGNVGGQSQTLSAPSDTKVGGPASASVQVTPSSGGGGKSCNTCGGIFSAGEYRTHFRSDWHRFNQKLKLKGVAPVSEQEFLLCDAESFFGSNDEEF